MVTMSIGITKGPASPCAKVTVPAATLIKSAVAGDKIPVVVELVPAVAVPLVPALIVYLIVQAPLDIPLRYIFKLVGLSSGHFECGQNLLCKEHRMESGAHGRTINMTNIIVEYTDALVNIILSQPKFKIKKKSKKNQKNNKKKKTENTFSLLHSKSIVVSDLCDCFQCLSEIVDGPNLNNQYYLSSSTPFLSICNRLVRHIYTAKQAKHTSSSSANDRKNDSKTSFTWMHHTLFFCYC